MPASEHFKVHFLWRTKNRLIRLDVRKFKELSRFGLQEDNSSGKSPQKFLLRSYWEARGSWQEASGKRLLVRGSH